MTMQGAWKAKGFVNDYLQADLPKRLLTYRNEWNLDDENLPEPLKYLVYEPIALDHWPTIITVVISMTGLTRDDYTGLMDPMYFVDYSMRTYVWVKDDSSEQCTAKRDRLTTVLRSSILDSPCLKVFAANDDLEVLIDESTLREEYSDLTLIKGERVMAGAYLSYNLRINEVVRAKQIGTANNISTEVDPLTPLLVDLE
jgi:hypothetical protein